MVMDAAVGPTPIKQAEWEVLGSYELDPQQGQLARTFRKDFQELISLGCKTVDIDDYARIVTEPERPVEQQLVNHLEQRTKNKLCLSPEYAWLKWSGLTTSHVLRSGRAENSAHQVFFALLHEQGDTSKGLSVAVKPCIAPKSKPATGCQDWLNSHLARKAGEKTFSPVGYMMVDGRGYSISEIMYGVETLDNSDWENVITSQDPEKYAGQLRLLSDVSEHLARLHKKNIFHGDPQFKNIAVDVTGEVFFIDWESATFYESAPEPQRVQHKMVHDLKLIFRSIALPSSKGGVGLIDTLKHNLQWESFKEHIFDPYMEEYLDGAKHDEPAFELIAESEEELRTYITEGNIYKSYARTRHHHD